MKQDPLQTIAEAISMGVDQAEVSGVYVVKPLANPADRRILLISDNGLAWVVSVEPLAFT